MANEFLVSVANAILRDPTTGNAIAYGKANIESSFTLATAETEVRGGINNPLLYTYIHDRSLAININQATFDKVVLGLNVGQLAESGAVNVTQTDCLVLSGGSGTLLATPTTDAITVFLPNGTTEIVTAAGSAIYVSAGASQRVDVVYTTSVTADQITVESTTPPSVVDLTMIAEVRDNTGAITEYLQISVPRFQVMGNYTLALAANGVSQQALSGKALLTASDDCTTADYYAKATWISVSTANIPVSSIAAIPSTIAFTGTGATSWPLTQQITVLGIRGGIYANANVTSSCTFAKSSGSATYLTVNASTGVVSAGSSGSVAVGNYINYFGATYYTATTGSLVDYVQATLAVT